MIDGCTYYCVSKSKGKKWRTASICTGRNYTAEQWMPVSCTLLSLQTCLHRTARIMTNSKSVGGSILLITNITILPKVPLLSNALSQPLSSQLQLINERSFPMIIPSTAATAELGWHLSLLITRLTVITSDNNQPTNSNKQANKVSQFTYKILHFPIIASNSLNASYSMTRERR